MRFSIRVGLAAVVLMAAPAVSYGQETADTFNTAYAKAEAASKKALSLKAQWTTTTAALAAAKKAAGGGDYKVATGLAQQAQAFAEASIAQIEREDTQWQDSELR